MSEKPQKISIGFQGGQVVSARVQPDALSALRSALGGNGWHDLAAEDGTLSLDLGKVDYVQIDSEAQRIGF